MSVCSQFFSLTLDPDKGSWFWTVPGFQTQSYILVSNEFSPMRLFSFLLLSALLAIIYKERTLTLILMQFLEPNWNSKCWKDSQWQGWTVPARPSRGAMALKLSHLHSSLKSFPCWSAVGRWPIAGCWSVPTSLKDHKELVQIEGSKLAHVHVVQWKFYILFERFRDGRRLFTVVQSSSSKLEIDFYMCHMLTS